MILVYLPVRVQKTMLSVLLFNELREERERKIHKILHVSWRHVSPGFSFVYTNVIRSDGDDGGASQSWLTLFFYLHFVLMKKCTGKKANANNINYFFFFSLDEYLFR